MSLTVPGVAEMAESVLPCSGREEIKSVISDGMKYWIDPRLDRVPVIVSPKRWFDVYYRPQSDKGVTISAYAILYNVYSTHNPTDVLKILKWVVSQRNEKGGFSSTQVSIYLFYQDIEFCIDNKIIFKLVICLCLSAKS